ncbi:MAG: RbsD/FucU domain-containing protein, partial [Victivallaceae bacterium]
MLKGIPTIISPDLLKILAEMGHGDEIVIADAHFPAYSVNSKVMRADGVNAPELAAAVMKLIELDSYVEFPARMMQTVPGDTA